MQLLGFFMWHHVLFVFWRTLWVTWLLMSGYPEWGQSRARGNAAVTIPTVSRVHHLFLLYANVRFMYLYIFLCILVHSNAQHSEQASLACGLWDLACGLWELRWNKSRDAHSITCRLYWYKMTFNQQQDYAQPLSVIPDRLLVAPPLLHVASCTENHIVTEAK